MTTLSVPPAADAELRQCVEALVSRRFGNDASIAGLHLQPTEASTFYATDVIVVALDTGTTLRIFRKDFGTYPRAKDRMEDRRTRELVLYRDFLPDAGLGTPEFYGSVWDDNRSRHWLLLEFVEGSLVDEHGFDDWLPAIAWLARFHARFVGETFAPEVSRCLERYDAPELYEEAARSALLAAYSYGSHVGDRLAPIVARHCATLDAMLDAPPTLLHGAFRGGQVLMNDAVQPRRVCAIDWELAGIGSWLYDFSTIADGFSGDQLDRMVNTYRAEAQRCGMRLPAAPEMIRLLNRYRLHHAMHWMNKCCERGHSERKAVRLVELAEDLAAGLEWADFAS